MTAQVFESLVTKLISKTNKKEAIWNSTSDADEFKLDLLDGQFIILSKKKSAVNTIITCKLSVYNEDGIKIDSIGHSSAANSLDYQKLLKLFSLVRNQVLKITETINDILTQLDSNQVIGRLKEDKKNPFL